MRYSRSDAPMRRKPVGVRVVMMSALPPRRPCESRDPYSAAYRVAEWSMPSKIMKARGYGSPFCRDDGDIFLLGFIPQLVALDLSSRRHRQRIHHVDPARIFPGADLLFDVLLQRFIEAVGVAIRGAAPQRPSVSTSLPNWPPARRLLPAPRGARSARSRLQTARPRFRTP